MDYEECGKVYPYAWDSRGSFVCKKPKGHGYLHEGRGAFTWITEAEREEDDKRKPDGQVKP